MKVSAIFQSTFVGSAGNALTRQEKRARGVLDAFSFITKSKLVPDYSLKMLDEALTNYSKIVNSEQYKAIKQRALKIRQIREANSHSIFANIKNAILTFLKIK